MWITRAYKQGNTLAMTFPKQMQRALNIRRGEYYAMILTEDDTVEIKSIDGMIGNLTFKGKEKCV